MINNSRIEQLIDIALHPVWDGNLISKTDRDELVKSGYIAQAMGFNFLTTAGVIVCVQLGILKS